MTDKQFTELNSLLKWNARDADFSTAFYTSLGGPEKTLEFYGRMSLDGTQGNDRERLALTRQLQRGMGIALATATDADNAPHLPARWGGDFRKLGTRPIELYPGAPSPRTATRSSADCSGTGTTTRNSSTPSRNTSSNCTTRNRTCS
ncbi:hypothetical protein ACFQ3Z_19820 [Streptomyces nogalater]